jgi:hypothetical protein
MPPSTLSTRSDVVASTVLEPSRLMPVLPDRIADDRDLAMIADDIAFWQDISERAFQIDHPSLGRLAAGLAQGHRAAWSRLNDSMTSGPGIEVGRLPRERMGSPGRHRADLGRIGADRLHHPSGATTMNFDDLDAYIDSEDDLAPGNVRVGRLQDPAFVEGLRTAPMIVAMLSMGGDILPLIGTVQYRAAGGPANVMDLANPETGRVGPIYEGVDVRNDRLPGGTFFMGCEDGTDDLAVLVRAVELLRDGCDVITETSYQVARTRPSDN